MATLLLRLAGPQQSWGDSSRFNHRATRREPTKSGVVGLLASAMGRARTEPIADLAALEFAVRTDQAGRVEQDFHTVIDWEERAKNVKNGGYPLTYRDYLTDACFLAVLEGDDELINAAAEALKAPAFPLFLGRRSCPPGRPVLIGVTDAGLDEALAQTPWLAEDWYRRRHPAGDTVTLAVTRDAAEGQSAHEMIRDVPVCFEFGRTRHELRGVVHGYVEAPADGPGAAGTHFTPIGPTGADHDPFALMGGS